MNTEALAIQKANDLQGIRIQYVGPDETLHNKNGEVEILEDMNCCAPTNAVLFSFQMERSRRVMSAPEFLEFADFCVPSKS